MQAVGVAALKSKRHKLHAEPQWACVRCCTPSGKPTTLDRECPHCKAPNAVRCFGSKRELGRWAILLLLEKHGEIAELVSQPEFTYEVTYTAEGNRFTVKRRYVADAAYTEGGSRVVEDSKGYRTKEYKEKKKIVEQLYGVCIRET